MFNLLNFFFPPYCINCNKILPFNSKKWVCLDCLDKLLFINQDACSKCNTVLYNNIQCSRCKITNFYFEKNLSVFEYNEDIRRIIHNLKFYERLDTADTLGILMLEYLSDKIDFSQLDFIIPVPMFKKRRRKRGYNQAEILAKVLSQRIKIPLNIDTLIKLKDTKVQSLVLAPQRKSNIEDSYDVINKHKLKNKKILLIDDVFTTGSTINECTRVLLKSGVQNVITSTLAITI